MNDMHSNVFKVFLRTKPDVVYSLKSCDHGTNIHTPSPHHMEGDVWTHTCIAYQSLLSIDSFNKLVPIEQLFVCLAVLCHDLGKPFMRKLSTKADHYHFANHAQRSVVEMTTICDMFKRFYFLSADDIYNIMLIVSAHTSYWSEKDPQVVFSLLNYDKDLFKLYKIVAQADEMGQIRMDGIESKGINDCNIDDSVTKLEDDTRPNVIIMMGCPACGKDTVAEKIVKDTNDDYKIFSFDNVRINAYQKNHSDYKSTGNDLYSAAWNWCNKVKLDLNKIMFNEIKLALNAGKEIIISNTNMSIKARARLINSIRNLGDVNVICIYVYVDKFDLIDRDNSRKDDDKSVGEEVIHRMYTSMQLPTLNEDIDRIIPIYNYDNASVNFKI